MATATAVQPDRQPEPCNLSKGEIQNVARHFAEVTRFSPGGEIKPIVNKLGGRIEFLGWEEWLSHEKDTIEIRGEKSFMIRLRASDGPLRHRFTIAHELGHYVLHSQFGRIAPMIAGRKGSNRVEWEANWFAAEYLMPESVFKSAAADLKDNILALAGRFMVSIEAAEVRLKTIKQP